MSIFEYVESVQTKSKYHLRKKRSKYADNSEMPIHQALVYAVENVVQEVMPTQVLTRKQAEKWLDDVCEREGIETPILGTINRTVTAQAVANRTLYAIGLSGKTNALTLCHELSHLVSEEDGHLHEFRSIFVELVREHVSVQHASLIHTLYVRVGLSVDPWQTERETP